MRVDEVESNLNHPGKVIKGVVVEEPATGVVEARLYCHIMLEVLPELLYVIQVQDVGIELRYGLSRPTIVVILVSISEGVAPCA